MVNMIMIISIHKSFLTSFLGSLLPLGCYPFSLIWSQNILTRSHLCLKEEMDFFQFQDYLSTWLITFILIPSHSFPNISALLTNIHLTFNFQLKDYFFLKELTRPTISPLPLPKVKFLFLLFHLQFSILKLVIIYAIPTFPIALYSTLWALERQGLFYVLLYDQCPTLGLHILITGIW